MTYEEVVDNLVERAGDYQNVVSTHLLKSTVQKSTIEDLTKKRKDLITSLSMGSCSISLTDSGLLLVEMKDLGVKTSSLGWRLNDTKTIDQTTRALTVILREAILRAISTMTGKENVTFPDISRFASYANLVLASVDEGFIKQVTDITKQIQEAIEEDREETEKYDSYVRVVSNYLYLVSCGWFKREAKLAPGMRVGIINRRDNDVVDRVIKKVSEDGGKLRITFEKTSTVVDNIRRIDPCSTWYFNTEKYTDIAKAIKWPRIAKFLE